MVRGKLKQDKLMFKKIRNNKKHLLVGSIVFLGFLLRIYQIGKDSFWLDEIGVAAVIFIHSPDEFVNLVRSHVAAVPFDYVITWIIGQFTLGEGWLRLPSAIWGTTTLIFCYILFKKITNERIALVSIICLCFSPLLIKYSQELRFYSSLVFFYVLSTKLLLDAFESKEYKDWIAFTIVTIIGGYFHIYVGLTIVSGFFWYFYFRKMGDSDNSRKLIISFIFILIGSLSAFYLFAGYNSRLSESITKIETIWQAIGVGLGWIPINQNNRLVIYVWGSIFLFSAFFGIFGMIINKVKTLSSYLFLSIFTQIFIILFLTFSRGYFIHSRHFIFLHPFIILLCISGLFVFKEKISSKNFYISRKISQIYHFFFVLIIIFLSLLVLSNYYREDKGNARETAVFLSEEWKQGDLIFFFPYKYSAEPVKYYLIDVMGYADIYPYMWTTETSDDFITNNNWDKGKIFLVGETTYEEENLFIQNGFLQTELLNVWYR
jgi:uncharacterized membrane protein